MTAVNAEAEASLLNQHRYREAHALKRQQTLCVYPPSFRGLLLRTSSMLATTCMVLAA